MTIGERIKLVRETATDKRLSMAAFGGRLGVSSAAVHQWEHGFRTAPEPILNLICSEFGISKEWLTSGTGDMKTKDADILTISAMLDDPVKRKLFMMISQMSKKELDAFLILGDFFSNYKKEVPEDFS